MIYTPLGGVISETPQSALYFSYTYISQITLPTPRNSFAVTVGQISSCSQDILSFLQFHSIFLLNGWILAYRRMGGVLCFICIRAIIIVLANITYQGITTIAWFVTVIVRDLFCSPHIHKVINLLVFILYYLRLDTAMVSDADTGRYAFGIIDHPILARFPYISDTNTPRR